MLTPLSLALFCFVSRACTAKHWYSRSGLACYCNICHLMAEILVRLFMYDMHIWWHKGGIIFNSHGRRNAIAEMFPAVTNEKIEDLATSLFQS